MQVKNIQAVEDKPHLIDIEIQRTGRTARIRRDQADVYPGRVYLPAWLAVRLIGKNE